jgi:excinuclease ABC subunit C
MLNRDRELIYVGKAKRLRRRLLSYFRRNSRDPKAGRILQHTASIVWEESGNEFAALLRELELIRRWRPKFNVQGRPGLRRLVYICLGRHPAPYAFTAPRGARDAIASFGPVPAGWKSREALRWLNDWYQLRDCPESQTFFFSDQKELFPTSRTPGCLRYEIGTCLGPCIGACTRSRYYRHIHQARDFLRGTDDSLLNELEMQMTTAASALQFERAALLRNKIELLRWLYEALERARRLRSQAPFVYRVPRQRGPETWYMIRNGQIAAVQSIDPQEPSGRSARRCAKFMRQSFGTKHKPLTSLDNPDELLLVAAWFRRHPSERANVMSQADAIRRCWEMVTRNVEAGAT